MAYYYTVYLNETDEVVASGTAKECAAQMHKTVNGIHSLVIKSRKGVHKKYTVVVEPDLDDDDQDEMSKEV